MGLKAGYAAMIAEAVARGAMTPVGGGAGVRLPADTAPPDDFAALLAELERSGAEPPALEFRFHPVRKWRFDAAWPGSRVALEREGGDFRPARCECGRTRAVFVSRHHSRKGLEDDAVKYGEAAVLGWKVIRATPPMLRDGRALSLVLRALALPEWSSP